METAVMKNLALKSTTISLRRLMFRSALLSRRPKFGRGPKSNNAPAGRPEAFCTSNGAANWLEDPQPKDTLGTAAWMEDPQSGHSPIADGTGAGSPEAFRTSGGIAAVPEDFPGNACRNVSMRIAFFEVESRPLPLPVLTPASIPLISGGLRPPAAVWQPSGLRQMMKAAAMTIIAVAISAAGSISAWAQDQSGSVSEPLTLERAIKIAMENNRSARNARLETDKADESLAAARTRRLPSFKINTLISQPLSTFDTKFEKGVFGTYPGIGPVPAEDTSIKSSTNTTALMLAQITQPITQLKRIGLQIKQLALAREISQAEVRATEQTIVNNVKRAYYAVLQTQAATRAAEESVKLYRELDRLTGEYVMQQVALRTDQLDVQTRLAKAEYQVLTLNNQLSSQKEQLNLLLGRDVNTDFNVADGLETAQVTMRETDLVQARQRAVAQRPEIREARLKQQQAELDRRAKKSEFIPDVSLTFNYISTFNYSNFVPRSVTGIGVQIEWEVFDWGRKKREVAEKAITVSQAENNLHETESQVLMEVNDRFRKFQESLQMVRIATLSQNTERANVQIVTNKYRLDAVLLRDVLQAQTSLANADSEYQKALLGFWTAKADFEKAMGEEK
jgi:outer membrane protein